MTTKPMTKTEVREWLKRVREGAAWAERALAEPDYERLLAAVQEIGGCAGQIESVLWPNEWDDKSEAYVVRGVRGMSAR